MRDYKLESLQIDRSYLGLVNEVKTEQLKPITSAFVENIENIHSLIHMPSGLFFWGEMQGRHHEIARNKVLGRNSARVPRSNSGSEVSISEIDARAIDDIVSIMTIQKVQELMAQPSWESKLWLEANEKVRNLGRFKVPFLSQSLESLLSGVLVGTWTAFTETLAGDLWVRSVNICPGRLGMLEGTARSEFAREFLAKPHPITRPMRRAMMKLPVPPSWYPLLGLKAINTWVF